MAGFILAEKANTTQTFDEKGSRIPVTFLKTTPCYLLNIKWQDTHGYCSVQLGFGKNSKNKKTVKGQLDKAGIETPLRILREMRLDKYAEDIKTTEENGKKGLIVGDSKILIGDEVKPSVLFKKGEMIDVTGVSKGKGFQGVVRRHKFAGGPKTHGQSDRWRAPGSMGQTTTPGRTYKGKRMAGRMGNDRVTVKNLQVVDITDQGIMVKGLVPGYKSTVLEVRSHIE